jgi:hypothetical protein
MEITYNENIERLLREDIIEKKKVGRGAFSMRGKGVKHGISGAFRTPSYFMTNKEKKQLNGEVETFNMYETILPYEDFKLKDKDLQKLMLTKWRETYDNMKIRTELGLSNKAFYDLVAELGIPKKTRIEKAGSRRVGRPKQAKPKATASVTPKKNLLDLVEESIQAEVKKEKQESKIPTVQTLITNGLHVEYNGNYDADTINKILTKIQLLVDGESNEFRISLSLSEISK